MGKQYKSKKVPIDVISAGFFAAHCQWIFPFFPSSGQSAGNSIHPDMHPVPYFP